MAAATWRVPVASGNLSVAKREIVAARKRSWMHGCARACVDRVACWPDLLAGNCYACCCDVLGCDSLL